MSIIQRVFVSRNFPEIMGDGHTRRVSIDCTKDIALSKISGGHPDSISEFRCATQMPPPDNTSIEVKVAGYSLHGNIVEFEFDVAPQQYIGVLSFWLEFIS